MCAAGFSVLCGEDPVSGFNFDHCRQWIVDCIRLLCSVFAVDLCADAIMSNHYHVVIRIDMEQVKSWSNEEVAKRWMQVFTGPLLIHQYLGNADLPSTELEWVTELFTSWRERLLILPGLCVVSMNPSPVWPTVKITALVGSGKAGSNPRLYWMQGLCWPVWHMLT